MYLSKIISEYINILLCSHKNTRKLLTHPVHIKNVGVLIFIPTPLRRNQRERMDSHDTGTRLPGAHNYQTAT